MVLTLIEYVSDILSFEDKIDYSFFAEGTHEPISFQSQWKEDACTQA